MKTKSVLIALLLTLAAGMVANARAQNQPWVELSPNEGRFSVMMPIKPEESVKTADSSLGKYTSHIFLSKTDSAIYGVVWVDYQPGVNLNVQAEINANRDNFVKGVDGTVMTEKKITLDDNPGIEFTAETKERLFKSRVYLVGMRPYMLIVGWPKEQPEPDGVATFLDSFKLTK